MKGGNEIISSFITFLIFLRFILIQELKFSVANTVLKMGAPSSSRFRRPKAGEDERSPNLFVANCGPAVGVSYEAIGSVFSAFGDVKGVYAADDSGARVIVSYFDEGSAQAAFNSLHSRPCPDLANRFLHISYSVLEDSPATRHVS